MSNKPCTPAPEPPPNAPSDWRDAVHGNCFSNIERLGQWTGKTKVLQPKTDPSPYFEPVTQGSLGGGTNPPPIYVVAHGWAPGYRDVVEEHGGHLLWWDRDAHAGGIWTSDWAWTPVTADTDWYGKVKVNTTGLLQQILVLEPNAVVLAYSWIDDSATGGSLLDLVDVYRSEAYTNLNGIRLANALEQAIAPSFWTADGCSLRLIGHSHGAKVVTVAALTLQHRGRPVSHLTTLDAPETESALALNGANLLGFYLEDMVIGNPSHGGPGGAFVDNYASYFGVAYAGTPNLKNVVEVALNGYHLYCFLDICDESGASGAHTYAAAWYGGAAAGAKEQNEEALGLDWPPPPKAYRPALNQNWAGGGSTEHKQWHLEPGRSIRDTYTYHTKPLAVRTERIRGNVTGDPSTRLIFGGSAETPPTYSMFEGTYRNPKDDKDDYGIAFDLVWIMPRIGDYLVVAMDDYGGAPEVLLVMDGQSFPGGKTSVAINCDVAAGPTYAIYIYFLAKLDATALPLDLVFVSNFRTVVVGSESGLLEARRRADVQERLNNQVVRGPRRTGDGAKV
jgi:hypothetical protein